MPTAPDTPPTDHPVNTREAYERCLPAMTAIPEAELRHPNIEVPESAVVMLQALPNLMTLRGELSVKLPTHDLAAFDALGDQMLGLLHAHTVVKAGEASEEVDVKALAAEGAALRNTLTLDAAALQGREVLARDALNGLKKTPGALAVAVDLHTLVKTVRNAWPKIGGRTGISLEELDHAEKLGNQILAGLGAQSGDSPESKQAVVMRMRAFTLFIRNHKETRRAVEYLRFYEGDADRFCPQLWSGKHSKKSAPSNEETAKPEPVEDETARPEEKGEPGVPGGNPFST